MYIFEKLDIYTNAVKVSAVVEFAAAGFPLSTDYFRDRLNRLASSIPSFIAEAHGHWKEEERREFFWKAREAAQECAGLIDVAARQGLVDERVKLYVRSRLDSMQTLIQDALRSKEKKIETPQTIKGSHGLTVV
jgi:four helix bundle protein